MNGLRYIRTRCNYSVNELAAILGVTRQAVNSWENGSKSISPKRIQQLEDFFGVDGRYFGNISDDDVIELLSKAMYIYEWNDKETYRYKPEDETSDFKGIPICFLGNKEISLDEEYAISLKEKKVMLERIDDIITWKKDETLKQDQIGFIRSGCYVFGMLTEIMKKKRELNRRLRVPFYYQIVNVLRAMMLAYELIDKKQIEYRPEGSCSCEEDGLWIETLATLFKEHWEKEQYLLKKKYELSEMRIQEKLREEAQSENTPMGIKEKILMAETRNKEDLWNNGIEHYGDKYVYFDF